MLLFYLSLIENPQNDDDFEKIYYKYRHLMYKVAKSHTNNHHLAEEALQNAFIGIAKNIDRIKTFNEDYLEIYLCKAAKNCAFSVLRKENNTLNKTENYDDEMKNTEFNPDDFNKIYETELLTLVINYIKSMKREYSDILTYYFLHDMTLKECSIALNIPLSTAKTRFYKGQSMLQEKFKEFIKWLMSN